jgi:prefoldin subunit 5
MMSENILLKAKKIFMRMKNHVSSLSSTDELYSEYCFNIKLRNFMKTKYGFLFPFLCTIFSAHSGKLNGTDCIRIKKFLFTEAKEPHYQNREAFALERLHKNAIHFAAAIDLVGCQIKRTYQSAPISDDLRDTILQIAYLGNTGEEKIQLVEASLGQDVSHTHTLLDACDEIGERLTGVDARTKNLNAQIDELSGYITDLHPLQNLKDGLEVVNDALGYKTGISESNLTASLNKLGDGLDGTTTVNYGSFVIEGQTVETFIFNPLWTRLENIGKLFKSTFDQEIEHVKSLCNSTGQKLTETDATTTTLETQINELLTKITGSSSGSMSAALNAMALIIMPPNSSFNLNPQLQSCLSLLKSKFIGGSGAQFNDLWTAINALPSGLPITPPAPSKK